MPGHDVLWLWGMLPESLILESLIIDHNGWTSLRWSAYPLKLPMKLYQNDQQLCSFHNVYKDFNFKAIQCRVAPWFRTKSFKLDTYLRWLTTVESHEICRIVWFSMTLNNVLKGRFIWSRFQPVSETIASSCLLTNVIGTHSFCSKNLFSFTIVVLQFDVIRLYV